MLIRYKKSYEKIAMGLLSFMPEEKDLKQLCSTMNLYEENEDWHLYLWKETDVIGLVGISVEEDLVNVQHISVNPSHRDEGIGKNMLMALKKMYKEYEIVPNERIESFYDKCELDCDELNKI